jgi:hypothetical protein
MTGPFPQTVLGVCEQGKSQHGMCRGGVGFAHRKWLVLWRVIQLVMQLKTEPHSVSPQRRGEAPKKRKKGRKGRRTFCASDTVSTANPTAHSTMPTTSRAVPNAGFDFDAGSDTAGELSTTTGKDTVQTCAIRRPRRPHTVPSRSVISFLKKKEKKTARGAMRTHKICAAGRDEPNVHEN